MSVPLLRFVHISDTHISHDPAYMADTPNRYHPMKGVHSLVAQLKALPFNPDFVLHTGDIVYDPDAKAYAQAREALAEIPYPVHYLVGNHDDNQMMQRVFLQRDHTLPELYYEFDANGVQVLCLDSTGPAAHPSGTVSATQMAWLHDIAKPDDPRPLVVAVHHNVLPVGVPWLDDFMRMENGTALHHVLLPLRDRLRGVFHGHIHQTTQTFRDGILYSSVSSSWYQLHGWPEQPEAIVEADAQPGFAVVTISQHQTYIRAHHFTRPDIA